MGRLGRIALFLVGVVLLAPGACSLAFMPAGFPLIAQMFTSAGDAETFGLLFLVWLTGVALGGLGFWLIVRSLRSHGR